MQDPVQIMTGHPETEIIQKIINGEPALFELLIRRYNPVLYKIARTYGFNHQDAEDLMQDTHVAAYTNLAKFEAKAAYKTWLSRIMINKCLYKLTYGYTGKEHPASHIIQENTEPMFEHNQNQAIETNLLKKEFSVILEKSLQKIPLTYRSVFILRAVEEFSIAETAALLNITPINVKVRLNRAKSMLQKELEAYYPSSDLYSFNLVYCDQMVKRVFEKITENANNNH
jgi:RNA polymerase sigma factor (sigma-70 family)